MNLLNLVFLAESESLGDVMARAGLNTAMGISIVFCALAFISIVIALEGKIFTSLTKKKEEPKKAETPAPAPAAPAEEEDLSNDEELVAVITAAIYAFEAEAGEAYAPADGLIVRSIRRRR
ncbi:MAG: OadG family protein [Lachnospiraceae bacterium]|nr:OadG family protein [Lachnospiraceae bacterium]MBO4559345.1 OadG family protein [Lachnospiraceae bacterium]MBR5733772.1 OadG family protein [Lachnospiraceae bacterium]